jgi:hypothetical protein
MATLIIDDLGPVFLTKRTRLKAIDQVEHY